MQDHKKRIGLGVLAVAALCTAAAGASAQSLSLSYSLEASAPAPARASVPACGGLRWLTALEQCGRGLLARMLPAGDSEEAESPGASLLSLASRPGPAGPGPSAIELPALGASSTPAAVRGVAVSAREPDLTFKVGSAPRHRAGEDAYRDAYRVIDTKYETLKQEKGHKAVGIELHVPFQ